MLTPEKRKEKNPTAPAWIRTRDLPIPNPPLYHWAVPAPRSCSPVLQTSSFGGDALFPDFVLGDDVTGLHLRPAGSGTAQWRLSGCVLPRHAVLMVGAETHNVMVGAETHNASCHGWRWNTQCQLSWWALKHTMPAVMAGAETQCQPKSVVLSVPKPWNTQRVADERVPHGGTLCHNWRSLRVIPQYSRIQNTLFIPLRKIRVSTRT